MGNTADSRMTHNDTKRRLGMPFAGATRIDALRAEADILAQDEHMPFDEALHLLSGQSRRPYGTPAKRR